MTNMRSRLFQIMGQLSKNLQTTNCLLAGVVNSDGKSTEKSIDRALQIECFKIGLSFAGNLTDFQQNLLRILHAYKVLRSLFSLL